MAKKDKPKKRKVGGKWFEEKVTQSIELVPTTAPAMSAKQKKAAEARTADTAEIKKRYDASSNLKNGKHILSYKEVQKRYYAGR
jgi:hypothetical protein